MSLSRRYRHQNSDDVVVVVVDSSHAMRRPGWPKRTCAPNVTGWFCGVDGVHDGLCVVVVLVVVAVAEVVALDGVVPHGTAPSAASDRM